MRLEFLEENVGGNFEYCHRLVIDDSKVVETGSQIYGTKNIVNAVLYSTPPSFRSLFSPKMAALEMLTL